MVNNTGPEIVIDGGGLITLSGGGKTRILYMNTCDEEQVWTTSHCQDQDHPRLTVQNLTFIDANSKSEETYDGGGAIWEGSTIANNIGGSWYPTYPQISNHSDTPIEVTNSVIE